MISEDVIRANFFGLLAQAPVPVAIVRGPDLVFEFANPAYHRMVSRDALAGRPYCEVFPEAKRDGADLRMLKVIETGEPHHIPEIRRTYDRRGDGTQDEAYFSISYTPMREEDGGISGLIITAIELTDQIRARNELQEAIADREHAHRLLAESERRLRALIDSAPVTIYTADPDGKVTFSGQSFHTFSGIEPQVLTDEAWQSSDVVHPDDLPLMLEKWGESLRTGMPFEMQIRLRRFDGVYRWHLNRIVPSRDETGNIVEWVGTSTDIDEEKRIETELNQKKLELEAAVQSRDEFLSLVSHELRSPLTVIMGYSRLIARPNGIEPEEQREWASDILRQSHRLQAIIENLLSMARFTAGDKVEDEVLLLPNLARRLVEEMRGTSEHKVILEADADVAPALANAFCFEQILRNLIGNAMKYSAPDAPIAVKIREEPDSVVVSVTDSGPGIDPAEAEKIFEPFYRSPSAAGSPGVGIGLTVCRRLAAAMGGELRLVHSSTGGSEFALRVPKALAQ